MPKKKKPIGVLLTINLNRKPTEEELNDLRKIFPKEDISYQELWERETKI